MRIAIAQLAMAWTVDENTAAIVEHLARAEAQRADVVLFPECATTGFHRRVPDSASREAVAASLARVREACASLGLSAVVGSPLFADGAEQVRNAAVAIGDDGSILGVTGKRGITASERRYFAPGSRRDLFSVGDVRCGAILCREIRDLAELREELHGARVVFWPGAIAWTDDRGHPDHVDVVMARDFARTLGCTLVQCNWPNSLNRPELAGTGGSLVVSPEGEVVHRLPFDLPALEVVSVAPA